MWAEINIKIIIRINNKFIDIRFFHFIERSFEFICHCSFSFVYPLRFTGTQTAKLHARRTEEPEVTVWDEGNFRQTGKASLRVYSDAVSDFRMTRNPLSIVRRGGCCRIYYAIFRDRQPTRRSFRLSERVHSTIPEKYCEKPFSSSPVIWNFCLSVTGPALSTEPFPGFHST